MSINQTSHSSIFGTGSTISQDVACSGSNMALVVGVSYVPGQATEVSEVTYDGVSLIKTEMAQIEDKLAQEVWYLTGPSSGTNTLDVTFSGSSTGILTNAVCFDNVAQTDPLYKVRTGCGKMVKDLPIKSFSKVSGIAIGIGATDNENSKVTDLSPVQRNEWTVTATGLNICSEAISAQLPVTLNEITVGNVLTEKADWAIVIIGLDGA